LIHQIRIEFPDAVAQKERGDFLEDLFRHLMERQRYLVKQRMRFTGTELDLLCEHRDRAADTALVECKARISTTSDDIKNFTFDIIVSNRARHGYFVHTTELQQQAAGLREELTATHSERLTFIGPEKLIEMMIDGRLIRERPAHRDDLTPTKLILLYTPTQKSWVTIYAHGASPSHYRVSSASTGSAQVDESQVVDLLSDEIQDLTRLDSEDKQSSQPILAPVPDRETIAEVQESLEWTDLKPVGSKYFVGRESLNQSIYRFVKAPIDEPDSPRVLCRRQVWLGQELTARSPARALDQQTQPKDVLCSRS
jgi:hypothetical protein